MIYMGEKLNIQDKKIIRSLFKNPRLSDNKIGNLTGVPIRTVNRKRKKLEEKGLLRYYAELKMGSKGTERFNARHMYLVKFRIGISQNQIIDEVKVEPNVGTIFTEFIYESHLAEIEGHTALVLIIEGSSDDEINTSFNEIIIPSLEKNHGRGSIIQITTLRVGKPIRLFHNYLPMVNMEKGKIKSDWDESAIFVA